MVKNQPVESEQRGLVVLAKFNEKNMKPYWRIHVEHRKHQNVGTIVSGPEKHQMVGMLSKEGELQITLQVGMRFFLTLLSSQNSNPLKMIPL